MKKHSFSSAGLILAKINYSEADRIFFILTPDYGRITLIAKGVRRLKSRKRGFLEVFNQIDFQATRGINLDILTDVNLIKSHENIRKNLKKTTLAYYFAEVLLKILAEGEKNEPVFNIAISYFDKLETRSDLKKLRQEFLSDILTSLGFWPKGKTLKNYDSLLEDILERKINSKRVGLKILA
jgi:DNA repair protein RecO (recombination protein O)